MSAAAAPAVNAGTPVPAKGGKKKLIIIVAIALLLLAIAGAGAAFVLAKKKPAGDADDDASAQTEAQHAAKPDLKHPPTFLPVDPFVVNLADKDADRYAQVGITFELEDAKFADQMKQFMPAIRNGILMILAHKGSRELMDRAGKEQLAGEIQRDAARTMGIAVDEPEAAADTKGDAEEADDEDAKPKAKPKSKAKKPAGAANPIRHVHFSNFIVQ